MTSDGIRAAIERLETMKPCDYVGTAYVNVANVTRELMDGTVSGVELRDTLIDMLKQADPYSHIELPKDADRMPIRIGDKVESDHREDGTVVGIEYCEDGRVRIAVRPHNWDVPTWWCDPEEYRHHHAPTVEDVLTELVDVAIGDIADKARNENMAYNDWAKSNEVIAEYAAKLREVMDDE